MGSILQNQTIAKRQYSRRQRSYFKARKTERPRKVQHEQSIQNQLCAWFKANFPDEHLRSDTGSGSFGEFAKVMHNRQQSHKGEPDIMIFAARRGYHGLLIELKADGYKLRMARDGRTMRVYKNRNGRIIERDYKIRQAGDWSSLHVERQANILLDYEKNRGYCARFAIGLEHAKKLISWYFDVPYIEPTTLF